MSPICPVRHPLTLNWQCASYVLGVFSPCPASLVRTDGRIKQQSFPAPAGLSRLYPVQVRRPLDNDVSISLPFSAAETSLGGFRSFGGAFFCSSSLVSLLFHPPLEPIVYVKCTRVCMLSQPEPGFVLCPGCTYAHERLRGQCRERGRQVGRICKPHIVCPFVPPETPETITDELCQNFHQR